MSAALTESIAKFREVLDRSESFLLTGHVNIDGDSLGSMLAMYFLLKRRGKKVRAIVFEPLAERYAFLGGDAVVEIFDPAAHARAAREADVFMMFDFSATGRIPGLWDLVAAGRSYKVCVDHHPADQLPGDLNIHEVTAPATGSIVLAILRQLGEPLDALMAPSLLVAISTDTGWFRYSNTTAAVLRDAAELLQTGIEANRVYREVYQRNDTALIRLMGRVVADLRDEFSSRLLWALIPQPLIQELGVGQFETDELLDLMRTGRDAECVLLFRELQDGSVRVNFRSRGKIDVSQLAKEIGGGGHRHAAGATVAGPLAAAAERVVARVRRVFSTAFAAAQPSPSLPTRSS